MTTTQRPVTVRLIDIDDIHPDGSSWDAIGIFDATDEMIDSLLVESCKEDGPYDAAIRAAGYHDFAWAVS